jgi:5-methyltetrahydrofolate--homocysteine methyltransferase
MVPAAKILQVAKDENADMIGLSGLITPSLDEMVQVAKEMQRLKMDLPLLIGGATTSKAHTAVKIEQNYDHPVIYVANASRAVGVCQKLISLEHRGAYAAEISAEYEKVRIAHAKKTPRTKAIHFSDAKTNKFSCDWSNYAPVKPNFLGVKTIEIDLNTLRKYIDWTPFFLTWALAGKYPRILNDEVVGDEAKSVFKDANDMLDSLCASKNLKAKGRVGIFRANSQGEDILVFSPDTHGDDNGHNNNIQNLTGSHIGVAHHLRQQTHKPKGPNYCLSDFVMPLSQRRTDYMGAFAVTAGIGEDQIAKAYEDDGDDYNAIMSKAIADRLAEAFAEYLHEQVRTDLWGYSKDEQLDNEALIGEKYQGIRPAPGYSACPEHTEKQLIWDLLDVEASIGMQLTSNYAMWPGASVSGWYFAHPESRFFAVAKIQQDQLKDYAQRKGWSIAEAEKWLTPNLNN